MQLNKKDLYEVEITKLAFGGKGIGSMKTEDGDYRVFVRNTIPGDLISVRLTRIKKNYAEAVMVELLSPSELRGEAKCQHFDICGGCTWQNLAYEKQLEIKTEQVAETMKHIGGFSEDIVRPIIPCDERYYYRNKMEFSFGDYEGNDFTLGMHPPGRKYEVFPLKECHLQSEDTAEIVKLMYTFFVQKKIPRYIFPQNKGVLRGVFLKHSKKDDQFLVNLMVNDGEYDWYDDFASALRAHPKVVSIYVTTINVGKGRRTVRNTIYLWGAEYLEETLTIDERTLHFHIDPGSFFQPNSKQASLLYGEVVKAIKPFAGGLAFDLYCGTGTISLVISHLFKKVYGFEMTPSAVTDAQKNAVHNDVSNAEFLVGDVAVTVPTVAEKPDVIVVDPPRSGLSQKAIDHLLSLASPVIAYISCNPATLARDLKIFADNGYQVKYVQPVDMFPQTYHIENVTLLIRE